jgi:hypothetical protein
VLLHQKNDIMNKVILSWAVLFMLLSKVSYSQSPDLFEDLDLTSISNGILLAKSPGWVDVPDGSTFSELAYSVSRQVVFELGKARLDSSLLPQIELIDEVSRTLKDEHDAVPIIVTDMRCYDFVEDAIENGLIGFENGKYVDQSGPDEDIFAHKRLVSCFYDREFYTNPMQRFVFPSSLMISNIESDSFVIQADFGNGQGWLDVQWDEIIQIQYPNASEDRHIKIKFLRDNQLLKSGFHLRSGGGQTAIGELNPAPWPTTNSIHPWRISVIEGEHLIKAHAYTLTSPDGIFDKPFIFVEGVDFGTDISPKRNGTFGWYEFSSGQSEKYHFLSLTPELISQLQEANYDIILLDFLDGADYIQRNSAILQHLISLVNEHKVGNAGNVIVGASMGGQVSRHALKTMEVEGNKHCCRLWISMDSPHRGAYIPAGIQGLIEDMAQYSDEAASFIDGNLKRPAAQQLLKYNRFANSNLHQLWYDQLDELGFPQECRNIAISNGSLSATPLNYNPGAKIIEYSWSFLTNEIIGFDVFALPGSVIHEENEGTNFVVSEIRIPPPGMCLDPACIAAELFGLTINPKITKVDISNLQFYDNAPGGKYNTTEQMVRSLNLFLDNYSWVPNISSDEFEKYHCFVSTSSALAMNDEYTFANIGQALENNPSLTPFDDFYAPPFANQLHTQVTYDNIDYVMTNLLGGEGLLLDELNSASPNNGVYNYCLPVNNIMPSITIEDGGRIHVNGNLPSHFAEAGDEIPVFGSAFLVKTDYCQSHIVVENGGLLSLGDANGNKGKLEIREGSSLSIEEGGLLVIRSGSEIRVKSGAQLISIGGQLRIESGAKITIEEGADFHWYGDEPMGLLGQEAVLELHGNMHVHDNGVFSIIHPNVLSGKIVVYSEGATFYGGAGAQIKLEGDYATDKIVLVKPNARFKCEAGFGTLDIQNGQIVIQENGVFENRNHGVFENVNVLAESTNATFLTKSATNMSFCSFENVKLLSAMENGLLEIEESSFSGDECQVIVQGQGFSIRDCVFEDCKGLNSSALSLSSTLENCHFDFHGQGDQFAVKDNSDVSLFVTDCLMQRCGTGLAKTGGELFLSCCEITHCSKRGLFLGQDCRAYLNAENGAGDNKLVQNAINIELANPELLELNGGYNTIRNGTAWNVQGFIQGECNDCENVFFAASSNNWADANYTPLNGTPGAPNDNEMQVWIYNFSCLLQDPTEFGCPALFIDNSPVLNTECSGHDDPKQDAKKSLRTELGIAIYPNPSSSIFFVHAGLASQSWQVHDLAGRCILEGVLLDGQCQIAVSDWSKGIYYLSIEGFPHKRLVVN